MKIFDVFGVTLVLTAAGCAVPTAREDASESERPMAVEGALMASGADRAGLAFDQANNHTTPGASPIAGLGAGCGGFNVRPAPVCGKGLFCNYRAEDLCGFADASGTCTEKPTSCPDRRSPVCGCNGQTYENNCIAAMRGVSVLHDGQCGRSSSR